MRSAVFSTGEAAPPSLAASLPRQVSGSPCELHSNVEQMRADHLPPPPPSAGLGCHLQLPGTSAGGCVAVGGGV